MCVCEREREREVYNYILVAAVCLHWLDFFTNVDIQKRVNLKALFFQVHSHYACWPFLILTRVYIYIYIVIHVDIVHLTQFLKFLQVKQHWYWYWYWYSTHLILLSLDFTSHFERFTKEIFTLLISWTANLYGSYNIHHYYYYYL